ncbi:thioredoxin fold domain-containing protein [Flaviramulus sp. BrNp1-15]|uniref:thioredoxin family protein n=1 Tax=Flaviramulus sp. BrNp1-15 TaxID=2916754 RepID=UPI001EE8A338|nr:thioredoxin fold domain-containing protein [Flaviramulus sp. BrNp1-15]ULC60374.1 thioredoxin fold domain-containing protein [Flaviramulus sp. BrNp1-15]
MKRTIYIMLLAVFTTVYATAQEIKWLSLEDAIALQKKEPKKIIMDIYTNWCGPCKMLDKNTFQHEEVADYINNHYYAVKFNGEGDEVVNYKDQSFANPNYNPANANKRNSPHDLARYFQVSAYPTIVFFDENGDVITPLKGYQTPTQLELYLKMFKKDDHKSIKTQEEFNNYYNAFQAEFKG